ncbi:MAG: hypothetical protein IPM80_17105 [Proteobacteria bacterium]|nr:hypothetical protein [Pseudomonadota bacterium]
MSDDITEPLTIDLTDNPISRVQSRVVPARAVRPTETVEPHLAQARRTCAALVATANDPPLKLKTDFDLVGIGRLRTTALENFMLHDQQEPKDGSFSLSFDYRGREPLIHVCASETVYRALRRKLYEHELTVKSVSSATASKLIIEARVAASVSFGADRTRELARITLRNVVMLGTTTYELPLECLDRNLVDALVELITSHGRNFYALTIAASQRRKGA